MRLYKQLISSLAVAALMAGATSVALAAPLAKGSYVVPQYMADNWSMFAGANVAGRIKKIEPWVLYESLNPCTIDENFCTAMRPKLQVATVQLAKSANYELTWVVTIPTEQYLKLGQVVQLILPQQPKELADMVLDNVGKIVTPPNCKWGQVVNGGDFEGVICERWNYSDLKFVAEKKKPVPEKAAP